MRCRFSAAEEEHRVDRGVHRAAHDARVDEAAQPQDSQRHDRVLQARLEREERHEHPDDDPEEAERVQRRPAVVGSSDDRVREEHDGAGHEQRPADVDAAAQADPPVAGDEHPGGQEREQADRQVHGEDPVPVEYLGERAAEQEADGPAAERDDHVEAHRLRPLDGLAELAGDDREDDGGAHRGADALQEPRADEHGARVGDGAQRGRRR